MLIKQLLILFLHNLQVLPCSVSGLISNLQVLPCPVSDLIDQEFKLLFLCFDNLSKPLLNLFLLLLMPLFELLKLISITTNLLDGIKNREFLEISRPLQGLSIRQKVLDLLHDVAVKLFRALQHLFILKNFLWVNFFEHVFVHPLL